MAHKIENNESFQSVKPWHGLTFPELPVFSEMGDYVKKIKLCDCVAEKYVCNPCRMEVCEALADIDDIFPDLNENFGEIDIFRGLSDY